MRFGSSERMSEAEESNMSSMLRLHETLGSRLSGVHILVLAEPTEPGRLMCGGLEMVSTRPVRCSDPARDQGGFTLRVGEKYRDDQSGLVVVCTRGGAGELLFNGRRLARQSLNRKQLIA